jgi:adenylate kinase family enzyme
VKRVSVVGNSGAGKTTLGRELAAALGVPFVELDSIFHQPGWQELPDDEYRAAVAARVADDAWVVDGNYSTVQDLVWARIDTVVWIDLPRALVMRQVVLRTLRRVLTREELWNGNREPFGNLWRIDPHRSIIRWAWTAHRRNHERYARAMTDPAWAHLRFVVLKSRRDVDAFRVALTSL